MVTAEATLSALRRRVAAIEASPARDAASPDARFVAIDRGEIDRWLGGGLKRSTLHEVHAASTADHIAAAGFCTALALGAASSGVNAVPREESSTDQEAGGSSRSREGRKTSGRPIVWIRQEYAAAEGGELHAEGLAALGLDPAALILARLRDPVAVLRAGVEAVRCPAVGAVLIEPWGEPKALDLTMQRRLSLAAEASGVTVFLLRPGARPQPGNAETRWLVRSGPAVSPGMNAPGRPAFELTLLRHRHGPSGGPWRLEWNRDERAFERQALLRDPSALPRLGPAPPAAGGAVLRLAG